jgi:hypothetical protein
MPKLLELNARGAQCYFGANPRKRSGESKEDGVALARGLFADFDHGVTVEEAWSRIKAAGLPMPTVTIVTGGGVHCWWRLDEPATDAKLWSKLQKQLAQALGSDQSVHDWPRIMRLPGFVNHKYEQKPLAELVDVDAGRVYSLAELKPATPGMSDATRGFVERGTLAAGNGRRETMFAAACDLRDHGWTPEAAVAVLMPRMRQFFDLSEEEIADCPRQIHNAWKREPRIVSAISTPSKPATSSPIETYRPFPVDALPEPLSSFVAETAAAIGCDPAYVAGPLLTATGAAIGTTRRLELKRGYNVPPIVWAVVVGESGTRKSAPLRGVLEYASLREKRLREEHAAEQRDYQLSLAAYEKEYAAWRGDRKSANDPPERPAEPVSQRVIVKETTVEALAFKLADNPRGLLMARDELNGWFGSLDRYAKQGGGSDESFYLSCYNAEPHAVDRRTGDRREIYVSQCALWITGTIQPSILQRALGTQRRESGLLARLLLTSPPARPPKWSEDEVSPLTRQYLHDILQRLYELQPDADEEGVCESRLVRPTADAKKAYVAWHDRHGEELVTLAGDQKAAWSKLLETAARLALIIHEVRVATGKAAADELDAESMAAGIELCEWFKGETTRTYAILDESEADRAVRQADERLAAYVTRQGGSVAVRDVIAGVRWIKDSETAETALQRLVDAGRGGWSDKPATDAGGRPTRLFVLAGEDVSAQPPKSPVKRGCADADACRPAEIEVGDEEYVEI